MATDTLAPATRQQRASGNALKDFIYAVFVRNIKAENCPSGYGRTSMGL